jgi:hypothetical protein
VITAVRSTRRAEHYFAVVEAIARRLEREDMIERKSYAVEADFHFDPCPYCDGRQAPAALNWMWDRHDATVDGSAECCPKWACVRAVLSEAEQDSDPEGITVEYPVLVVPTYPEAMAA